MTFTPAPCCENCGGPPKFPRLLDGRFCDGICKVEWKTSHPFPAPVPPTLPPAPRPANDPDKIAEPARGRPQDGAFKKAGKGAGKDRYFKVLDKCTELEKRAQNSTIPINRCMIRVRALRHVEELLESARLYSERAPVWVLLHELLSGFRADVLTMDAADRAAWEAQQAHAKRINR